MITLSNVWGLFYEYIKWVLYPSSDNPILYVLGASVILTIGLGFLKLLGFRKRYNDG